MLAEKYFDYADKISEEFIISEKLDGNRIILIKENNSVKAFTRQGQAYEGLVEIEDEAKQLEEGVYDGELIALNPNNLNSADLYRLTTSIVRKDGIKKGVTFNVFDLLPIEDFQKGECGIPCVDRKNNLNEILNGLNLKHIVEVPTLYIGEDKDQITYWLDKLTSEGKEGCMVNVASSPYKCKRNKGILKVKKMQSADCEVVGFEEGTGRNEGTLGAIVIDYKGYPVKVGSGYSDEDRSYIWSNQNELLGRVIEVQFFEESTNKKDDSISLRFPVFKIIREEGKEVSYY